MNKEILILVSAWIIITLMLIIFIPRNKIREAIAIFLFKHLLTWVTGFVVAELGLIEYPVRPFANATKSSFDFEFYIFPAICCIFNLHYPEGKGKLHEFMHYFNFCSVMTIIEVLIEKYSNVIKYIHWTWYITWITLFITFFLSRTFYIWYFRLDSKAGKA